MNHIRKFNEGILDGGDFLYKEILPIHAREFEQSHELIKSNPPVKKVEELLSKAFTFNVSMRSDGGYSLHLLSRGYPGSYIVNFFEDEWILITVEYTKYDQWGYRTDDAYHVHYLCDGLEGVEALIPELKKERKF